MEAQSLILDENIQLYQAGRDAAMAKTDEINVKEMDLQDWNTYLADLKQELADPGFDPLI